MTISLDKERLELEARLQGAEGRLQDLHQQLDEKAQELQAKLDSGQQFQLLGDICSSLHQLDEMGQASLFWGAKIPPEYQKKHLSRVQHQIAGFQQQLDAIRNEQEVLQQQVDAEHGAIGDLSYLLDDVLLQEEQQQSEYIVEREERELPFRPMLMPWLKQKEDQIRYRKAMGGMLAFLVLLNMLIVFWEIPEIPKEEIEVPEHLVQMVKKDKPKPKPPVKKPEPKEEPKKNEQKVAKDKPKPKPAPQQKEVARKKAEASGVLAFKDSFSDLLSDDVDQRLGASASLTNKAASAKGESSRSLVMSQAKATSGGINSAALSRGIGGTAGSRMGTGKSFSRVTSAIGTDMVADDRPLSDGVGPSRTDEEIQIVFDRYKATLYRIYNLELRKDPMLKGKMVLRITIEPNGAVSFAAVESTNMNSQQLVSGVLNRVKRFNFGPKEGVPTVTILYPIDFLPAA
ncbi:AgmX/PglI C-terminal domain-containing protein [Aestuariicella hydrocarbonica]|uniref:AgmX/PglI C-terminal domain-containing protein n=1 Tax=Pseudomaricurvus hydrocarbonicus TaxID=1470433 RepID=A0A9E5MJW5_9GAMM|nr:AgmX/PglI C-terminal domain-containing protein [Aestuariicella hydrocarbonica]